MASQGLFKCLLIVQLERKLLGRGKVEFSSSVYYPHHDYITEDFWDLHWLEMQHCVFYSISNLVKIENPLKIVWILTGFLVLEFL